MAFALSITVDASAEQVWSILADVERWPTWTASVTSIERLETGPFGVGSRARVRQPGLPTVVWTVTQLEPQRSFTWRVVSPGTTSIGEHSIAPGPGNAVTVTLSVRHVGVLAPIVSRVYAGVTRRYIDMEARGLKRLSESRAAVPAADFRSS